MNYTVIYEQNKQGHYSAYIPDLQGCTSSGTTLEETKNNIKEAILLYLEELREDGKEIPPAITLADTCKVTL
jgi:predicted RNase H-like HicB family nuclease